jgi:coenzyme F420 hydrogenase subunit beta
VNGTTLDAEITRVVAAGNCSGCGGCLLLDSGLRLELDDDGFGRPMRLGASTAAPDAAERFRSSCPGLVVAAQNPPGSVRHPTMGPVVAAWEAWAVDPEIRRAGSSGGTLTALASWLVSTGRAASVTGARSSPVEARRTVSVTITSRDEAIAAASSRYAPVTGALAHDDAMIGLPCRVAAVRAQGGESPILLSFFCAGTPSQRATDSLAQQLGSSSPSSLRYRGDGWPGRFTIRREDGATASLDYEESWGAHLGRDLQWRCKICPDGVGESADIIAADLWESDERGYPVFGERDGVSALIARTARGRALVEEAISDGVLVAAPLAIERLAAVQPLQVERRSTLAGRLLGARLAGAPTPRFRGFGLFGLALPRWRAVLRVARGTYRRRRA